MNETFKNFFLWARKFDDDGNGDVDSARHPVLGINANIKPIRSTGFVLISIGVLLATLEVGILLIIFSTSLKHFFLHLMPGYTRESL